MPLRPRHTRMSKESVIPVDVMFLCVAQSEASPGFQYGTQPCSVAEMEMGPLNGTSEPHHVADFYVRAKESLNPEPMALYTQL